MTAPETLMSTIRQVPGVSEVRRWTRHGEDRAYIRLSLPSPLWSLHVDLRTGDVGCRLIEGDTGDPHELGARAVKTIRSLCESYRDERAPKGAGR